MKIYKHFDYQTPFSVAENDEERATILRLKYPKACSNLETGAEFFARMVEEVRKTEVFKLIGFDTFEAFCAAKLGKTLHEVEEIVQGVKILGGNPTEKEAKKASRSARAAELVKAGTHTQAQAAREVGISKQAVNKQSTKTSDPTKRVDSSPAPKPPKIRLTLDPSLTAANIIKKMGEGYARRLVAAIQEVLNK